jgi:hypothetical protein
MKTRADELLRITPSILWIEKWPGSFRSNLVGYLWSRDEFLVAVLLFSFRGDLYDAPRPQLKKAGVEYSLTRCFLSQSFLCFLSLRKEFMGVLRGLVFGLLCYWRIVREGGSFIMARREDITARSYDDMRVCMVH